MRMSNDVISGFHWIVRALPCLALLLTLGVFHQSANAQQSCLLDTASQGGGVIDAVDGVGFDAELVIEIGPGNSFVRLENQQIRVIFEPLIGFREEFPIRHFVIKDVAQDQLSESPNDYFGAGAGIGSLSNATVLHDGGDKKTIRMEWNQWDVVNQVEVPERKIIRDYTIYPFSRHLKVDFVDIQYAVNVTDLGRPGGTFGGSHVAHGHDDWIRGYVTHDLLPGLYYSRYAPDGLGDPVDGGSLSYGGNFIMGVYAPANGRGYARVMPVADTHIIKLLLSDTTRRGIEYQNYPFLNPHPSFTGYLYAVTGGRDEILATGRRLVDEPEVSCGDVVDVEALAYSGWVFSHWTGDLTGVSNPELITLDEDHAVTGHFTMAPSVYGEDFDSYVAGDDPAGWADTASGGSLASGDAFKVAVSGGDAHLSTTSTATNIHSQLVGVELGSEGYEYTGSMRMSHPAGGVGVTVLNQYPSSLNYYRLRRYGSTAFHLTAAGSSFTSGDTDTGLVPLANVWYRFRIRVEMTPSQTEIRAMVWIDGEPEPTEWMAEGIDASATRLTDGTVGVWSYTSGSKSWDDLSVHALTPPPTDLTLTTQTVGQGSVSVAPDQPLYSFGDGVQLSATADTGWVFDRWTGDVNSTQNPVTLNMTSDRTVVATFVEITQHTLTLSPDGLGSIDETPVSSVYDLGSQVTLVAVPGLDQIFTGWGGDASGAENPLTITIGGDTTVSATFVPSEVAYSESFDGFAAGDDPPSWLDTGPFNSLAPAALFDVQADGGNPYFQTVSGATNIHSHLTGLTFPSGGYRFSGRLRISQANSGIGVTIFSQFPNSGAYYRLRRYNDTAFHLSPFGTALSGDLDTGFVPPVNTWVRFLIEAIDEGALTRVRAKVWHDGDSEPLNWQADALDGTSNRMNSGTVGVWTFLPGQKCFDDFQVAPIGGIAPPPPEFYTVATTTSGDGTVNANPDLSSYEEGTTVQLEALPDAGFVFDGWSGAVVGVANPITVTVDADLAITAAFVPITQHPIVVTAVGQGSATQSPDLAQHDSGSTVTLAATADAGWVFAGWSGDVAGAQNPIDVVVTGDMAVTATFVEPTGSVLETFQSYSAGDNPSDWMDTGARNSLNPNDNLFSVAAEGANRYFETTSTQTNIHSHATAWVPPIGGYQYAGRMRIGSANSGIGVTFFSGFGSTAQYYRLRRYVGNDFHISPLGTTITGGDASSGVSPLANTWYRFRIEVEDTGTRTDIRARVWLDGTAEPTDWSIDCYDDSATRLTGGTVGVWAFSSGSKGWDDLSVDPLGPPPPPPTDLVLTTGSNGSGIVTVAPDLALYDFGDVVDVTASADPGWVFTGFSGDISSNDNPLTVTMTADLSLTANFVEIGGDYFEDFNSYVLGDDPANWFDTQPGNSLAPGNSFYVGTGGGTTHLEISTTESNVHSHFVGALPSPSGYEFTGRMKITRDTGGIGVTFFSQFPNEVAYYRLRRYIGNSFHVSPVGTSISGGATDTGVVPLANVWYAYRIQVEDTGSQTEIRANVWVDGDLEPAGWQVDCFDSSTSRLTTGTVGVWSFWQGAKRWDDIGVQLLP